MRQENLPSFDDTMTGKNIQALMFQANSFEELRDLNDSPVSEVLLKRTDPAIPFPEHKKSTEVAPTLADGLPALGAEKIADAESVPDDHAARRSAMFERRRRRGTRRRRAMRAGGAPRISMF